MKHIKALKKRIAKIFKKIRCAVQYMIFIRFKEVEDKSDFIEINAVLENAFADAMERDGFAFSRYTDFTDSLSNILDNGGKIFKALYGRKVVGTIAMKAVTENKWYYSGEAVNLCHFAVLPKYQSIGIGRKLVESVENEARAKGLPIVISTPEQNVNTIRFYENRGYSRVRMFKANDHYAVRLIKWTENQPMSNEELRNEFIKTSLLQLMKNYEFCDKIADKEISRIWKREFYKYIKNEPEEIRIDMRKKYKRKGITPKKYTKRQLGEKIIKEGATAEK